MKQIYGTPGQLSALQNEQNTYKTRKLQGAPKVQKRETLQTRKTWPDL